MKRNLQHTMEDISRFVFSLRRLLLVMTAWLSGSHAVLRTTLFLWLCRLPFLVLYFPGSFAFPDTEGSVQHYFGYADLTTVLVAQTRLIRWTIIIPSSTPSSTAARLSLAMHSAVRMQQFSCSFCCSRCFTPGCWHLPLIGCAGIAEQKGG